jgi:bacteriocin-like protein
MSDQEQKQQSTNITPEPDAENKKNQSTELNEDELKKVSGGNPSLSDMTITKTSSTSSSNLS